MKKLKKIYNQAVSFFWGYNQDSSFIKNFQHYLKEQNPDIEFDDEGYIREE